MAFELVAQQIFTLLIILSIGYIIKKINWIDEISTKKLATLLINVTSPALIFFSFIKEYDASKLLITGYVSLASLLCFILSILLAEKIFFFFIHKEATDLSVLKASAVFSNCGYMGMPLIHELYGSDGVFYVSTYIVIFQILIWTYGLTLYSKKTDLKNIKKLFRSPAILAVSIGLVTYILQIPVHPSIQNASLMIGSMTTPIAMLIIGSNMSDVNFKELLSSWKVYYVSFLRLILLPTLFMVVLSYFPLPSIAYKIIITSLAMPVAVNVAVFAEKFGCDPLFASKVITLSTILSLVTIPFILQFL